MNAIILAAGSGSRLRPFTDNKPKCLVSVCEIPILEHELECLGATEIEECVIVIGYRGEQIRATYGDRFKSLRIRYVENPHYQSTNNLYSLWLAREAVEGDVVLLEGDLVFEPGLLTDLISNEHINAAVLDQYQQGMSGTVMLTQNGVVHEVVLISEQYRGFDYSQVLKTVNLYKFSGSAMQDLIFPAMDRFVSEKKVTLFYEAVLADLIAKNELLLGAQLSGPRLWAEVDTPEDLEAANEAFREAARRHRDIPKA